MRFHTLAEWLQWQETLHPKEIELGLERVSAVWRRLAENGLGCPVITVGGTNGKGSCVAMLEAILSSGGYRVGCYTSPHLLRYNERVRIQGREATDQELCAAFERVDRAREGVQLTYFEFGTLAALDLFVRAGLELVILEVGLGGRLDAVNIVDPEVALLTSIGLDHTDWLGDSLEAIALEKAGILRSGRPAVIAQADCTPALTRAAREVGALVYQAGEEYHWRRREGDWSWQGPARARHSLPLPALRSAHQLENAAGVLMALECLAERFPVSQYAIRAGLQQATLPGRLQVVAGEPTLILDVAHNPAAAQNLARDLERIPRNTRTFAVFGCFSDKDAQGMAQALASQVSHWYLAPAGGSRGMAPAELERELAEAGIDGPVRTYGSVDAALDDARERALPGDTVLVFGSFLLVAAVLASLDPDS